VVITATPAAKALSLKDIIQYEVACLFRRHHLNRDVVIGIVGDRGDGKSIGGAVITVLDWMLEGDRCWSNLSIQAAFNINNALAHKYGFSEGGKAEFQSEELDFKRLLSFDPEYKGGVLFIDEINVAIADARRTMSNQTLAFDDLSQQLRKLQMPMIYTSIHEMFVESRVRDITDIFISTRDTALTPEGLARRRRPGEEFEWTVYPMTRKLTGERYADTRRPLPPVFFHGKRWWGTVETLEYQTRQKYGVDLYNENVGMNVDLQENPRMVEAKSKWSWLYDDLKALHSQGIKTMQDVELWKYLRIEERDVTTPQVGRQLSSMGVKKSRVGSQDYIYHIDDFDLSKVPSDVRGYVKSM